ncbi:MAG: hypothetical protein AAF533_18320 [Acidobacteriota bacterium]
MRNPCTDRDLPATSVTGGGLGAPTAGPVTQSRTRDERRATGEKGAGRLVPTWVLAWLGLVIAGHGALLAYQGRPAPETTAPSRLPVPRAPGDVAHQLLVFAHPRCPCTQASFSELERLLSRARLPVSTQVHFFRPAAPSSDWSTGRLHAHALRWPSTRVLDDVEGRLARRCGALASGHVLLYGPDDVLLFAGGVTASRGHEGPSVSGRALAALLDGRPAGEPRTAVFGCELQDEAGGRDS